MKKLLSLHKHWITANAIKQVLFVGTNYEPRETAPESIVEYAKMHTAYARMSVLYGLIYVVVEGYKGLKLSDDRIDELLKEEKYIDQLRLYRNATFHYQKNPIPEKELTFLESEGGEHWIRALHYAFQSYFERIFPTNEVLIYLKDGKT